MHAWRLRTSGRFCDVAWNNNSVSMRKGRSFADGFAQVTEYADAFTAEGAALLIVGQLQGSGWRIDDESIDPMYVSWEIERSRKRCREQEGILEWVPDLQSASPPPDPLHPELERRLRDNPTDPEAYHVYGDWLVERGDPRGELIALHRRRADVSALREHHLRHKDRFAGALAPFADFVTLSWFLGFIENASLHSNLTTPTWDALSAQAVDTLLKLPSARFLQELSVSVTVPEARSHPFNADTLFASIGASATPCLRKISMMLYRCTGELAWMLRGVRGLHDLTLRATRHVSLYNVAHPTLRTLHVKFADREMDGVHELLMSEHLPSLTWLRLTDPYDADVICQMLCMSPMLAQLEHLEIDSPDLTADGVEEIRRHVSRFRHLKTLHLQAHPSVNHRDLLLPLHEELGRAVTLPAAPLPKPVIVVGVRGS